MWLPYVLRPARQQRRTFCTSLAVCRLRCDPCTHLHPSQDNSLCDDKSYRPTVLRKMRSLQWFDGLEVTAVEKETFADATGGVTLAMVQSAGMSGGRWGKTGSVHSHALSVFWCLF